MMGQADSPEIARVRQFAAAVREGMAGRTPQPGVLPTQTANEVRARQAGIAAAPILGPGGRPLGPRRLRNRMERMAQPPKPDRKRQPGMASMRDQVQGLASLRARSALGGPRPAMFGKG